MMFSMKIKRLGGSPLKLEVSVCIKRNLELTAGWSKLARQEEDQLTKF